MKPTYVHPTAVIDPLTDIGEGTSIWHFCHVSTAVSLGKRCTLGQNVYVAPGVRVGANVKIQNNVSLYEGVHIEDDVFLGPSCVFTNVKNPRSQIPRKGEYVRTLVKRGATIGANATIICGATIGRYAFVGAGAVVLAGVVPDYALMVGVPAEQDGWMSRHGFRLGVSDGDNVMRCSGSGWRYRETGPGELRCLDWDEERPLDGA
jgi:UDP-2-acetamido-3-amino-2,3-dideoxy-glucuronate N-acetyltransferase